MSSMSAVHSDRMVSSRLLQKVADNYGVCLHSSIGHFPNRSSIDAGGEMTKGIQLIDKNFLACRMMRIYKNLIKAEKITQSTIETKKTEFYI